MTNLYNESKKRTEEFSWTEKEIFLKNIFKNNLWTREMAWRLRVLVLPEAR